MSPHRYRLTVQGHLSERFWAGVEGLAVEAGKGRTSVTGTFRDRSHLRSLLDRIADSGLELLAVEDLDDATGSHPEQAP